MDVKIGSWIRTPRFCSVKIDEIFANESEARTCGYTEPTYYDSDDCVVLGKSIGVNRMVFAAIPKE